MKTEKYLVTYTCDNCGKSIEFIENKEVSIEDHYKSWVIGLNMGGPSYSSNYKDFCCAKCAGQAVEKYYTN